MLCTRVVTAQEGFEKALKDKVDEIWLRGGYAEELIKKFDLATRERKTSDGKYLGAVLSAGAVGWLIPGVAIPAIGIQMVALAKMLGVREPLKHYELAEYGADFLLLKRKERKKK